MVRPGILALQGGFAAHGAVLNSLGYEALPVRGKSDLNGIDCLILPGGESTVMVRLLMRRGMWSDLLGIIGEGVPLFGTCAGMILLSSGVEDSDQPTLAAMGYRVARNAYGRQRDSFETDLSWRGEEFSALFIRAPRIQTCDESLEILLSHDRTPVLVRQKNFLAASFHPELTGYSGIHRYFMEEMAGY